MNISNRLYTYPVLCEDKDDYCETEFDVKMKCRKSGLESIHFEFDIKMNNKEIEELIKNNKAEYIFHIECATTSFREIISSITMKKEIDIPIKKVKGKVEILALIVVKEDVKNFISKDWNNDYLGLSFNFRRGNIIAYKNIPNIEVSKNYSEFKGASSIFSVQKMISRYKEPFNVNMDGHQIKIELCEEEYNTYCKLCQVEEFQSIVNSMIIFPSLIYIFEALQYEGERENYIEKEWFKYLDYSYKLRGVDLLEELSSYKKTSLEIAQEAMELPIIKSLSYLNDIFEDVGEKEDI